MHAISTPFPAPRNQFESRNDKSRFNQVRQRHPGSVRAVVFTAISHSPSSQTSWKAVPGSNGEHRNWITLHTHAKRRTIAVSPSDPTPFFHSSWLKRIPCFQRSSYQLDGQGCHPEGLRCWL